MSKTLAELPAAMEFSPGCLMFSYGQHSKCADLLNSRHSSMVSNSLPLKNTRQNIICEDTTQLHLLKG